MRNFDWLEMCRRVVGQQRRVFAEHASPEARNEYEGIGEGGDRTLVIDRLCEDAIFAELEQAARGGASFRAVSEERGEVAFGDGEPEATVVIDPIDGSLNARRGLPSHSLSIAVAEGSSIEDVVFGYVYDFGAGEEFSARRGQGWALNGEVAERRPAPPAGDRLMEVVGMEAADPDRVAGPAAALADHAHRLRVVGSIAITACYVAAGRLDGMITLGASRSVDIAAAHLILREAGGVIAYGGHGPSECDLGIQARYPVAAAATAEQLAVLGEAQALSPALQ